MSLFLKQFFFKCTEVIYFFPRFIQTYYSVVGNYMNTVKTTFLFKCCMAHATSAQHPCIDLLKVSGCPLKAVYRRMSELPTRNQFKFTIKILVYTIEFSTIQVFIPSTASFSLMVVLDVCVLFSRNSCGKCIFIFYICFHDCLENLLCTFVGIFI